MVRLATVFSGIGAVEHALKRMGVDHEIIFACDNGEVDVFSNESDRLNFRNQLDSLGDDWEGKKRLVDELYGGVEKKNKVRQSYTANYEVKDFHWDVAFLDGRQYRGKVDLLVGGSPCQSFSVAGKRKGLEDTRGTLFYEFARMVEEVAPKVFIYENVQAVLWNDNGKTWEKMRSVFDGLDYECHWAVLNASDYGIPQNRKRLFVVGFRNDVAPKEGFSFPEPVPLKSTMKDYLEDDENPNLEKYFLSEKMKNYVLARGTKNYRSRPETDLKVARSLLTTMHKMHRAGVDNYVTTKGRLRRLTPRECLRLMGFGDDFKIVVSDTAVYQQAGNSIVVDVLIAVLRQIDIEKYGV